MDDVQMIFEKIAAHDKFNAALEKKLIKIKVMAIGGALLLFALFTFVIQPRMWIYFTALVPLLSIVIAVWHLRRQSVLSGAEIRQYLDNCKDDKDFAELFIPLIKGGDYLTQNEDDFLTDFIINRSRALDDNNNKEIIRKALSQTQYQD